MTPKDLLLAFRKQVQDEESPYLWEDFEFLQWLGEAQDEFAVAVGGISDTATVAYLANDVWLPYDTRTLRIIAARDATTMDDIAVIDRSDLNRAVVRDYGRQTVRLTNDPGPVRFLVIGLRENSLRMLNVPTANGSIEFDVMRLPLHFVTEVGYEDVDTFVLEIDARHHMHLLKYVKSQAYQKQDAETIDDRKAKSFADQWESYVESQAAARDRRRFKPRITKYGGI